MAGFNCVSISKCASIFRPSEDASLCKQRAGLQHQRLYVDAYRVEHCDKVLGAEQGVCQSKAKGGGDEASTVLHHPRPGAPLDRRGFAHFMNDCVT